MATSQDVVGGRQIPFVVAGTGGHNDSQVDTATGQVNGDNSFDKSMKGFGYLMVTASAKTLQIEFRNTTNGAKAKFDSVTVTL